MIIKVDAKGKEAVELLCDQTLKSAGNQGLQVVTMALNAMEIIPEPKKTPKVVKKEKK